MPIATVNPATGETLETFDALTPVEVEARIARAWAAFERHRDSSLESRTARLVRAAGFTTVAVLPGSGNLISGQTAGFKLKEAATVLDISPATARKRHSHILKRLAAQHERHHAD